MQTRDVYLINGKTLSDSDTVTKDLSKNLKIQHIRFQYTATNGGTSNTLGKLNSMVSKLALVDGSDVHYSLSMQEGQALNCFQHGKFPYQNLTENKSEKVTEEVIMNFGRYLDDPLYYLDTSRLANPSLSLTHDLTISATAGFATGTGSLTAVARVIESGAQSTLGHLMAKEIASFASAASGDQNINLPLDYPIVALMVLDPADATAPDAALSNFKISIDTDKMIPVDMSYTDLLRMNRDWYGAFEQTMKGRVGAFTSETQDMDLYQDTIAWTGPVDAVGLATVSKVVNNEVTVAETTGSTTGEYTNLRGSAPHSAVFWPFGDGNTPADFFNPQGVSLAQLILTQAATGQTVKVVVIQARP